MGKRVAVYIGRFAPLHNGHMYNIDRALKGYDELVILVGSANKAPNPKTPWSVEERTEMLERSIGPFMGYEDKRVRITPLRDFDGNDDEWVREVMRSTLGVYVNEGDAGTRFFLIGAKKDMETSKYLERIRTELKFTLDETPTVINDMFPEATDVREIFFEHEIDGHFIIQSEELLKNLVPTATMRFLAGYRKTEAYKRMREWRQAVIDIPNHLHEHDPVFVTVDSFVRRPSGEFLYIRRGGVQGHGQFALPGGFVEPFETLVEAAKRELKEECGIHVDEPLFHFVMDQPNRSCRGRTITHVFGFHGPQDDGQAGSDADYINWQNVGDVGFPADTEWFEDHRAIITKALTLWPSESRCTTVKM